MVQLHRKTILTHFFWPTVICIAITFDRGTCDQKQQHVGRSLVARRSNYDVGSDEGGGIGGRNDGTNGGDTHGGSNNGGTNGGGGEILASKMLPSINPQEPSCEELRAMWRFSKRQSRAAEITNEIPSYRDPFVLNVWQPYYPYPVTRSIGGTRIGGRYRDSTRPIFGRVVHKEPIRFRDGLGRIATDRSSGRTYDDRTTSMFGPINMDAATKTQPQTRRRVKQFRFAGQSSNGAGGAGSGGAGANGVGGNSQNSVAQQRGSFMRLKELIWTERARELAQQRKAEELAARAAVLKEIAKGQSFDTSQERQNQHQLHYQQQRQQMQQDRYNNNKQPTVDISRNGGGLNNRDIDSDSDNDDEFRGTGQLFESAMLPFPDILAPTSQLTDDDEAMYDLFPDGGADKFKGDDLRNINYNMDAQDVIDNIKQESPDMMTNVDVGPPYLRHPQPQSHFRERNRATLRHGFTSNYYQPNNMSGKQAQRLSSYIN